MSLIEDSENMIIKNQYKIIKKAGAGTFGTVYEAIDTQTNQKVAVKEVLQDPKYKNRELDIISLLNSNNIIEMKDYCFKNIMGHRYLYLVMEYFPTNLLNMFKELRQGRKTIEKIKRKIIAFQIFKALYYLKEMKICHRDIKPSNILIDPQTLQVKVCDFGASKVFEKIQQNVTYICSRHYRAPQLIFNYVMYGTEIDVWSAGCILAQLLTRQAIFPGDSRLEQLIQIIKLLGTPSQQYIQNYTEKFEKDFIIPEIPHTKWQKVFAKYKPEPEMLDLISKIFVYDPIQRATPFQILKHPYFHDLIAPENKSFTQKLPNLFIFDDLKTNKNHKEISELQNLYHRTKLLKSNTSFDKQLDDGSKLETGDSSPMPSLEKLTQFPLEKDSKKKQHQTCDTIPSKTNIQQKNISKKVQLDQN